MTYYPRHVQLDKKHKMCYINKQPRVGKPVRTANPQEDLSRRPKGPEMADRLERLGRSPEVFFMSSVLLINPSILIDSVCSQFDKLVCAK